MTTGNLYEILPTGQAIRLYKGKHFHGDYLVQTAGSLTTDQSLVRFSTYEQALSEYLRRKDEYVKQSVS